MKLPIWRISVRIRVALVVAALAACARIALPGPPEATLRGVAEMLGASIGGEVDPDAFVWESSRGGIADAVLGRRILFLGRAEPGAPRDLYRAAVRVTTEGKPVSVRNVVNLTASPMGDEQGLVANGRHVAFATVAFGSVQQVTLLDLRGPALKPSGTIDTVMGALTNLQASGSVEGLGRTEVSTNLRTQAVQVMLDDRELGVTIDGGVAIAVSLESSQMIPLDKDHRVAASCLQVPQLPKPPILWAVDTVRSVTGPAFIAWLEDNAFDARDAVKRAGYHAFSEEEEVAEAVEGPTMPPPPPEPEEVGADDFRDVRTWPPSDLRSIWKKPEEGEGVWNVPRHKFLQKNEVPGVQTEPPSYFYQTYVRPDAKRPWSKVWMVAMDSRQLSLGMEGGIEDPQPLTGARGEGRIPRDPEILHRAVGAFNGGFKTTHGEYGMMVAHRVLLPPKPGGATIMVTEDSRTGFGTWPESSTIPQDMLSFRQNLDPLIDGGRLNPTERKQWGWHLHTTGMLTHRSGLCLTSSGHMVYAWGPEVTGETLGNAMIQAGCTYAVHLDMNPRHTAFAYVDARKGQRAELLHPGMQVLAKRFIVWSPKDFFYLTLRRFAPPPIEGVELEPDEGTQPPPDWAPSVFRSTVSIGGKQVELRAFSPRRVGYELMAETKLDSSRSGRVLAALVAPTELGMKIGGRERPDRGSGVLLYVADGKAGMLGPRDRASLPSGAAWLELDVLMADGSLTANARNKSESSGRVGICVGPEGFVWVGRAKATSGEPVARALEKVGCRWIGASQGSKLYRTGTGSPPVDRYEDPVLYLLGTALRPGAFRWHPERDSN